MMNGKVRAFNGDMGMAMSVSLMNLLSPVSALIALPLSE